MKATIYVLFFLIFNVSLAQKHFDSNVIVNYDETKATIIDFEEATYYYRIFDIAMLFIGLCIENNTINFCQASSILKGYTNNI